MLDNTMYTERQSATNAKAALVGRDRRITSVKRLVARQLRAFPKYIDAPELRFEHDQSVMRSDLAIGGAHFRF